MKILLDECLPLDLRHAFEGHEAHTVQWAGLKSLKNGDLLRAAEAAGYEILLTVDQGFPYQHRTGSFTLAIIVLKAATNQIEDLSPLADSVLKAVREIKPGEIIEIGPAH